MNLSHYHYTIKISENVKLFFHIFNIENFWEVMGNLGIDDVLIFMDSQIKFWNMIINFYN